MYHVFFFFFQAEDGIRDYKVTGVQTCALPILRCVGCGDDDQIDGPGEQLIDAAHEFDSCVARVRRASPMTRSEERRVGKSVDLGGRRIIKKKKKRKGTRRDE